MARLIPLRPVGPLADIIGPEPRGRPEITAAIWEYLKTKGLRNKENRRMIDNDAKLKKLSGKAQMSMFELTKVVAKYLETAGDEAVEVSAEGRPKKRATSQALPEDFDPTSDEVTLNARVRKLMRVRGLREPIGIAKPKRVKQSGTGFVRDPAVKAWVLMQARGSCEACGSKAPFKTDAGAPFLETHHVVPLADGGPDTTRNSVAVCPNCHRRLHMSADRDVFRSKLCKSVKRLPAPE